MEARRPAVRAAAVAGTADRRSRARNVRSSSSRGTDEDVRVRTRGCRARRQRRASARGWRDRTATRSCAASLTDRLVGDRDGAGATPTATRRWRSTASTIRSSSPPSRRSSPHDTVRAAALGRVHESEGAQQRRAPRADPQTALDAVARVSDPAELLNIALKTEHKDAGVAALERSIDAARRPDRAQHARDCRVTREEQVGRRSARARWSRASTTPKPRGARGARAVAAARRVCARACRGARGRARRWPTRACSSPTPRRSGASSRAPERSRSIPTRTRGSARWSRRRTARSSASSAQQAERRALPKNAAASLRAAKHDLCERVESAPRRGRARSAREGARRMGRARRPRGRHGRDDGRQRRGLHARFEEACRRAAERHENRQAIDADPRAARRAVAGGGAARVRPTRSTKQAWNAVPPSGARCATKADGLDPAVAAALRRRREHACAQRAAERRAAEERAVRQQVQRIEQLIERAHEPRGRRGPDAARSRPDRRAICAPRSMRRAAGSPRASGTARRAAEGRARRRSRRSCTSCARWTSGSGSPTPRSRRS